MHMISQKDLCKAEMDTLTKTCSPTIVITANGEVQTHEEAILYVTEMGIFLTMKVLENTPSVLSLGKLCDENGSSYEWINGQKPHLIKTGFGHFAIRRTLFLLRFQACQVLPRPLHHPHDTYTRQESHSSSSSSSSPSSPTVGENVGSRKGRCTLQ